MKYELAGPYELPREHSGLFSRVARIKREFWDGLEHELPGLSGAHECYLFSVRNVVWYVGKAERQSFRRECFTPDKTTRIDEASRRGIGPVSLMLLPRMTAGCKFQSIGKMGGRK